jgi:FAD synthase
MTENEIIGYQFAERIKTALIIGSRMLTVLETLKEQEFEVGKKMMAAFFDALSIETGLAFNATGMKEFELVDDKVNQIRRRIDERDLEEAHATLGAAVSRATTACERTMRVLIEKGLM